MCFNAAICFQNDDKIVIHEIYTYRIFVVMQQN